MNKPAVELAEIFRGLDLTEWERQGFPLTTTQRRVLRDIGQCRTAALGGHLEQCDPCAHGVQLLSQSPLSEMSGGGAC